MHSHASFVTPPALLSLEEQDGVPKPVRSQGGDTARWKAKLQPLGERSQATCSLINFNPLNANGTAGRLEVFAEGSLDDNGVYKGRPVGVAPMKGGSLLISDDLQISIRGFGARSTFGVRGVRLFVGGIPASAPDGSGQAANIPIGRTQRIEVVRGPFASLSGGLIDHDSDYRGFNARWRLQCEWQGGKLFLSAGLAGDRQTDLRRGFENFIGAPPSRTLGVLGALRREETNRATTLDPHVLVAFHREDRTPEGGVRHVNVRYVSSDAFLSNDDQSGSVRLSGSLPVVGLHWQVSPQVQAFASLGRGLQSPTFNEAAYRSDGVAGLYTMFKELPRLSVAVLGSGPRALASAICLSRHHSVTLGKPVATAHASSWRVLRCIPPSRSGTSCWDRPPDSSSSPIHSQLL